MKLTRRFESQDKRIRGTPRDVGTLFLVKIIALSYIGDVAVIFLSSVKHWSVGQTKNCKKGAGSLVAHHNTKSSRRSLIGTLYMTRPENIASDADGVETLPGSLASLLHCLHWRHEHDVQPGCVLDINIMGQLK